MRFYEYVSGYDIFKKMDRAHDGKRWFDKPDLSVDAFYVHMTKQLEKQGDRGFAGLSFERDWHNSQKPYYKVYPSIVPMLTKIDIDKVKYRDIKMPSGLPAILIRFSENNKLDGLITSIGVNCFEKGGKKYILFSLDVGLKTNRGNHTPVTIVSSGTPEETIGDSYQSVLSIKKNDRAKNLEYCTIKKAYKLVCTLCLLGDSPELIQPEVLNADEHKLQGQHSIEALVAKARRRGKYGFTIGKDIEVMPHYRRPHLALVWYGPGKKESKIIPRKGSIVHRSKVEKIPTGYAMEE